MFVLISCSIRATNSVHSNLFHLPGALHYGNYQMSLCDKYTVTNDVGGDETHTITEMAAFTVCYKITSGN
jgi:hypothetical protein